MHRTRRFWTGVAAGVLLLGLGVLAARPLFVLGGGGVLSVLVARQFLFLRAVQRVEATTEVDLDVSPAILATDQQATLDLSVSASSPIPVPATVTVPTPVGARIHDGPISVTLQAGDSEASSSGRVSWPLAGRYALEAVELSVADGLLRQGFYRSPECEVVVRSAMPWAIHVGEGGRRLGAFGSHRSGELGTGIEPAELREYVPGDRLGRIDWKSTARQGEVYVQEFEVTTDRRTVILFDHRGARDGGPRGQSPCDYLRQVALAHLEAANRNADPVSLYGVGAGGVTVEHEADTGPEHYRVLRETLREFEPSGRSRGRHADPFDPKPDAASRKAVALASETTTFAQAVHPFVRDAPAYVRRIEGNPLFEVARSTTDQASGSVLTVIFTDDSERAGIREAAKVARAGGGTVVVFLAPLALFADADASDVEDTYERYRDFESFRRDLARMDRVSAYEVAPEQRIDSVLAVARDRR